MTLTGSYEVLGYTRTTSGWAGSRRNNSSQLIGYGNVYYAINQSRLHTNVMTIWGYGNAVDEGCSFAGFDSCTWKEPPAEWLYTGELMGGRLNLPEWFLIDPMLQRDGGVTIRPFCLVSNGENDCSMVGVPFNVSAQNFDFMNQVPIWSVTYSGVSRAPSELNVGGKFATGSQRVTYLYDRIYGVLVEENIIGNYQLAGHWTEKSQVSARIIDTNLNWSVSNNSQTYTVSAVIAVAIIIGGGFVIVKRRRSQTKESKRRKNIFITRLGRHRSITAILAVALILIAIGAGVSSFYQSSNPMAVLNKYSLVDLQHRYDLLASADFQTLPTVGTISNDVYLGNGFAYVSINYEIHNGVFTASETAGPPCCQQYVLVLILPTNAQAPERVTFSNSTFLVGGRYSEWMFFVGFGDCISPASGHLYVFLVTYLGT